MSTQHLQPSSCMFGFGGNTEGQLGILILIILIILIVLILILILILLILSQVWVWGGNTEGQLGLGEEAQENVFTPNQLLIQDQVIPRFASFS